MSSHFIRIVFNLALPSALVVACAAQQAFPQEATFSEHIVPLLQAHCVECHNPDGIGPFSLMTYDQVKRRSRQITEVIESRFMPPWKPDPEYGPMLQGERRLTDEQIAVFSHWGGNGHPPGDGLQNITLPEDQEEWDMGPPDLVLEVPEGYVLQAEGNDVYHNFVIPIPLKETRYVRAVEFKPLAKLVIHHAQITFDSSAWSREKEKLEQGPGFSGMQIGNAANPTGYVIGWTPGQVPFESYPGAAWELNPGKDLVLRLHMLPSGRPVPIGSKIGFYFTDEMPRLSTTIVQLGARSIDIPAGEANYIVEESMRLPASVRVLGMYPHAHYIGKDMKIFAKLPDGHVKGLLRIPDWDFNWQSDFRFENPVRLPAGSELVMRYSYDNSANNPRNPFSPPQRIAQGWKSTDEMGEVVVNLLLENPEDRLAILEAERSYIRESMGEAIYYYERGMDYWDVGMLGKARDAFEKSLDLDPEFAMAANNLGAVHRRLGEHQKARALFERALRLTPENALFLDNLLSLLITNYNLRDAQEFLEAHLASFPRDERARLKLADFLLQNQQLGQTIRVIEEGLDLNEDSLRLNFRLGVIHSQTGDFQKAKQRLHTVAYSEGDTLQDRRLQADAFFALALQAIREGDFATFRESLGKTFSRQFAHKGARFFAAGGALSQGNEATARQHLQPLIDLPESERPAIEDWISGLSFPAGQILAAKLYEESGDHLFAKNLLQSALQQARKANNPEWIDAIESELSRFSSGDR